METRHLIDAIVQQTTLLIAQLATSAGIRAPLANIADQVFLDLSNEIEQQGITREVVADMFGLALRTYQKKVNRLRESVTETEQTLWQSVLSYVRDQAFDALIADHRVRAEGDAGEERFYTQRVLIPVGSEAGWETAVFDHFRAVCTAIAGKLREGGPGSDKHQLIGGSTLCFDIEPGHACEEEVKALLGSFRERAFELWNRVSKLNQASPIAEANRVKVVFYFGQNVIRANGEDPGT